MTTVFDHRCLRHLAHIKWADRVSNAAVRRRVFRNVRDARSIGQVVTLHSLRWLGHVLRMPAERLPYRALYTEGTSDWVKPRGGQATTWSGNMKTMTAPLSKVGRHRLPGWGPRDHSNCWLQTLSEMANLDKYVKNFSNIVLNRTQKEALSVGLKFSIPPQKNHPVNLQTQFECLHDRLKSLEVTLTDAAAWFKSRIRGSGVVLLDRADYINEMQSILLDTSKFVIDEDQTDAMQNAERQINRALKNLHHKGLID
ncbi:uncharacterized protein DEA37_0014771 [Paragonimus westermani]|uniref:Uncharacterized protein n=1 Tax=Paragonimus westermani TaxID=34504 RepID=A0A5J4NNX8_9TREM|nr:uncharacterized protein DEA37_0014771 [Paragonimus westermani]